MIVCIDGIIYWLQKNGGASRYWYEISTRLIQSGVEVHQIRRPEVTPNPWARILGRGQSIESGRVGIKIDRYLDCSLPRSLKSRKSKLVFHSSHYRLPIDKSIANVVTVHDFTYEMYKNGVARWVHVWQKKRAIQNADVVICISEFTKQQLIKLYPEFASKQIEVIYHGVGTEFSCQGKLSKEPGNEIVFLGSRDHYKRFDLAISATQYLRDKLLTVVGPVLTPAEEVDLDEKITGRWRYAGRLSDKHLSELYNRAFCFVYPSDSEGFGLPLLEAMSAGCPVVCSNLTVFPEVAGDAALFANEQTGAAYAEQMVLLSNLELRAEMISRGFKRVSLFTWENCFNRTLEAYSRALIIRNKRVSA